MRDFYIVIGEKVAVRTTLNSSGNNTFVAVEVAAFEGIIKKNNVRKHLTLKHKLFKS